MIETLSKLWRITQFSRKQQQAFLEDLAWLMSDGVSVAEAVETIRDVSEGIQAKVASQVARGIAEGAFLADGMQGWFSRATVEIIRAGELSGTLVRAIQAAARTYAQRTSAFGVILNSLLYPLIVFVLALVLIVFIKHSVLQSFTLIKPVTQWPQTGQTLYHFATLIETWWWLYVLLLITTIIFIGYLLHNLTGQTRTGLDNLPLFALYRDIVAARFMETLGLLISNGVVLKRALGVMHLDAIPYLSWHLLNMEYRLSGGKENVADVLDTNLIRRKDLLRLKVIAQSKGFEHALISMGQKANEHAAKVLALTGKIMGALVLAVSASLAATMVLGIYTVGSSVAS